MTPEAGRRTTSPIGSSSRSGISSPLHRGEMFPHRHCGRSRSRGSRSHSAGRPPRHAQALPDLPVDSDSDSPISIRGASVSVSPASEAEVQTSRGPPAKAVCSCSRAETQVPLTFHPAWALAAHVGFPGLQGHCLLPESMHAVTLPHCNIAMQSTWSITQFCVG